MECSSSSSCNEHTDSQGTKRQKNFLHSVRNPPTKPWRKPLLAPLQQPKVYRVVPADFRRTVQTLTGAPEFQSQPLRTHAPLPLNMVVSQPTFNVPETSLQSFASQDILSYGNQNQLPVDFQTANSFDMSSPSWQNWSLPQPPL
ncbi:hypothetical protein ACHQM5_024826 [Ranunculus cassubicifolius]